MEQFQKPHSYIEDKKRLELTDELVASVRPRCIKMD